MTIPIKSEKLHDESDHSDGYSSANETELCRFNGCNCSNLRAVRHNGSLHRYCEQHRVRAAHSDRRQRQRDRLLRYLVNALENGDPIHGPGKASEGATPRRRPRLVLLGNQQTLILGVVLSDRRELDQED